MACVDIGRLRAYCDGELTPGEAAKLERHLAGCARCKAELEDLRTTASLVSKAVSALDSGNQEPGLSVEASLASMRARLAPQSEAGGGLSRLKGLAAGALYQWRFTAAGIAAVAIVAMMVALPPVRSVANDLLGVFRVQKFAPVAVEPEMLANLPMLDPRMMGTFEGIEGPPNVYTDISVSEARDKVDFPIRLPGQLPSGAAGEPQLSAMDAFSFSYTFDLARAQAYMESMGLKGISLPKTPDGQKVSASMPSRIFAQYGDGASSRLMLIQGKSPVLEVPDGVNMEEVRNAVLSFPGLPAELVIQLRALDWKTTAPVPVIKGDTSRQITVDGVEGLLINSSTERISILLWQKEDIVYALGGQISDAELIAAANSMR